MLFKEFGLHSHPSFQINQSSMQLYKLQVLLVGREKGNMTKGPSDNIHWVGMFLLLSQLK
ncbi:unnamed protein product, partial [Vitis vinifera]